MNRVLNCDVLAFVCANISLFIAVIKQSDDKPREPVFRAELMSIVKTMCMDCYLGRCGCEHVSGRGMRKVFVNR